MTDVSMCQNENCPSKHKCYRYTFTPNSLYQSYSKFTVTTGNDKCPFFVRISRGDKK